MKQLVQFVASCALLLPIPVFATDNIQDIAEEATATVDASALLAAGSPDTLVGAPNAQFADAAMRPRDLPLITVSGTPIRSPVADLEAAANAGNLNAQVELGTKYAHAEGVPKDLDKANNLYCRAAKYGDASGLYNLGWAYANGRGVPHDDGVAALLFRMAAERGHKHAPKLLSMMQEKPYARLPSCMSPNGVPLATLPPAPRPTADFEAVQIPVAPKEIAVLVQRLAPQFQVDSDLALALIAVESAFNPMALSPAKAQGLMQLIPETAERFGVKKPFNPDENVKGGLAYLRWLLAYFKGDVALVLAAYNAGEGAVDKYKGIPPYPETVDYVKKIIGMYRRLDHPYNASVVKPSPVIDQIIKRM